MAPNDDSNREELAHFLRSRRRRVTPADVGLATGPRRRSPGLLREEVAVLAGLSPTWYTYLEQGRKIRPSPEVLDSLARVLLLTEDERRYMHVLVHGQVNQSVPLDTELTSGELIERLVDLSYEIPYPVYSVDRYCDLLAWNQAAADWYEDWAPRPAEHNFLHWLLFTPQARERLVDWENEAQDVVARWRSETAKWRGDRRIQRMVAELREVSPHFAGWWDDHDVQEHRSRTRRFRHPELGIRAMRVLPVTSPEFPTATVVFHLPVEQHPVR